MKLTGQFIVTEVNPYNEDVCVENKKIDGSYYIESTFGCYYCNDGICGLKLEEEYVLDEQPSETNEGFTSYKRLYSCKKLFPVEEKQNEK